MDTSAKDFSGHRKRIDGADFQTSVTQFSEMPRNLPKRLSASIPREAVLHCPKSCTTVCAADHVRVARRSIVASLPVLQNVCHSMCSCSGSRGLRGVDCGEASTRSFRIAIPFLLHRPPFPSRGLILVDSTRREGREKAHANYDDVISGPEK